MTHSSQDRIIRAQELIGRKVRDADGHDLGRVYDLAVARAGDELRVESLLIGARSWITRFGWSEREHGQRIPWDDIVSLAPDITIRGSRKGSG